MDNQREYSLGDLKRIVRSWCQYFLSKWLIIFLVVIVFMVIGILYASYQKPKYIAEIVFAPENDKGSSLGYMGLAAQFGIDLGSGGGSVFEGENLSEFLKSKMLIRKTLFTVVEISGKKDLLINYYIDAKKLRKLWSDKPDLNSITFTTMQPSTRLKDSIMKKIVEDVEKILTIEKVDKKTNFIVAREQDTDELFAKKFIEQLVSNGIQYYVDYRSKKSRENVAILQKQTDSVEGLLTGNIVSVATSTDLNVNPIRQISRANVQRKQVDVTVNSQVYGELLKQLELAKISLRKETPLIQIIDMPMLPLEKKVIGRLKAAFLFGSIGLFLFVVYLFIKRLLALS